MEVVLFLLMTRAHHDYFNVSAYKENYIPDVKASKSWRSSLTTWNP